MGATVRLWPDSIHVTAWVTPPDWFLTEVPPALSVALCDSIFCTHCMGNAGAKVEVDSWELATASAFSPVEW